MTAWVETSFVWPGSIEFRSNFKDLYLFLDEKTHNTKVEYVHELVEHFPKFFSKVDFYKEEGIEKAALFIAEGYNVELK